VPARPLIAAVCGLCACGLALSVAAAAPSRAHRPPPPPPVGVEGVVTDWDEAGASLRLEETVVTGAPKRLRRVLRRAVAVRVVLVARSRIVAEHVDGTRERLSAADLADELDMTGEDVDVVARGRLVARTVRPGRVPDLVATRVVAYLPDPDLAEEDPLDPGDDEVLPGDEDPLPGDEEPLPEP